MGLFVLMKHGLVAGETDEPHLRPKKRGTGPKVCPGSEHGRCYARHRGLCKLLRFVDPVANRTITDPEEARDFKLGEPLLRVAIDDGLATAAQDLFFCRFGAILFATKKDAAGA